jgi:hypothetical protein
MRRRNEEMGAGAVAYRHVGPIDRYGWAWRLDTKRSKIAILKPLKRTALSDFHLMLRKVSGTKEYSLSDDVIVLQFGWGSWGPSCPDERP